MEAEGVDFRQRAWWFRRRSIFNSRHTLTRKDFWTLGAILLAVNILGLAAIWNKTGSPGLTPETVVVDESQAAIPSPFSPASLPPRAPTELVEGAVGVVEVTPDDSGRGGSHDPNLANRITVTFDRPVVGKDETGEFLDWDPFEIEPIVDGRWSWSRPDQLELRLERKLPGGNRFTLGVADDFEKRTGARLLGVREFQFSTRGLKLTKWQVGRQDEQHAEVDFNFNQTVDPQAFKANAVFFDEVSGGKLEWTSLTESPSTRMRVRIAAPRSRQVRGQLDASLTGLEGTLGMEGDKVVRLSLRGRFHARLCWPVYPKLNTILAAKLRFSRVLDRMQRAPRIDLVPVVPDARVSVFDSQIVIRGSFQPGQTYRATLASDVLSGDGQTIAAGEQFFIDVKDRGRTLSFSHPRGILGSKGNLLLELKYANLKGVEIEATRIYENNLVHFLNGRSQRTLSRYGRSEVASKLFPLESEPNVAQTAALDLRELLDKPRGVYQIDARVPGNHWESSTAIVTITDLALTTKRHRDGIVVWVTSLETGGAVAGVEIAAMSASNQNLARAKTDVDGLARLAIPEKHPDGSPWAIFAQLGEDRSYRILDRVNWMFDDVELGGRAIPRTYDVFLYSERGVHRPGDTAYLTGVVRDAEGATPAAFPLEVRVFRPDGKKIDTLIAIPKADAHGVFHLEYKTWANGRTGRYRIQVGLPGSSETLANASLLVEAVVPARIEVQAASTKERFSRDEFPSVDVSARYLFDQPAADLAVVIGGKLERMRFSSAAFPQYTFGEKADAARISLRPVSGALDEQGKARLEVTDVLPSRDAGLWRGRLLTTVTEYGGRSVTRPAMIEWDTAGRHLGLNVGENDGIKPGEPHSIRLVLVDAADMKIASGEVKLKLEKLIRDWSLQDVDGRLIWRRVDEPFPVKEWIVDIREIQGAADELQILCPDVGAYRLSARDLKSGSLTTVEFTASDDGSPAGEGNPNRLELTFDKSSYRPGSEAILRVQSPIAGKGLITVETDEILHLEPMDLGAGETIVKLPVAASIRGSAFVTATVVRPVDTESEVWKVFRANGIARLKIDHSRRRLEPEIRTADRARPGETARVTVSIPDWTPGQSGVVHLWAVDEGILQLTDFQVPDPFGHFFAERGQAVQSGDSYSGLLPDFRRPADMERIGAGGGRAGRLRLSPIKDNRKPPAVIWRTVEAVGADGRIEIEMNLPDMTGELRLMAVAVSGDRYGMSHKALTVTAPFLIEPSLPRFVAPGDEFSIPVKVFNTTKQSAELTLQVETDGPIRLTDSGQDRISIEAGGSKLLWLRARAEGLGPVEFSVLAKSGDEVSEARATMAVRPAAPLGFEARSFVVEAGKSLTIEPPSQFLGVGTRAVVTIGGSPLTDLRPVIERLISYPHGCIEQTTSRLFTMLHAPSLLTGMHAAKARHFLAIGVDRIGKMQTTSGGFGYWPGDDRPNLWGTLHVTEFLLEVQESGLEVDPQMLTDAGQFLQDELYKRTPKPNLQARICRLLVLMNKPETGRMAALGESLGELDKGGRASLAGAWIAAGRSDLARNALPDDTLNLNAERTFSGRLTSPVAQNATLLRTLLELNPEHAWIPTLAKRVDGARTKGLWSSTLDNAMALAALTEYQAMRVGEAAEFTGFIAGGVDGKVPFSNAKTLTREFEWGAEPLRIASHGKGRVFVSITTEGLLKKPELEGFDRELMVRRSWTTAAGDVIWGEKLKANPKPGGVIPIVEIPDPAVPVKLKVGDLIFVDVTIRSPERRIDNIAIVDALPGGVEIENPHLSATAVSAGRGSLPSRTEFLDDRALLFVSADQSVRNYRYALRVVAAGKFVLPPIQASSMYDVELASVSGAGRLEVVP